MNENDAWLDVIKDMQDRNAFGFSKYKCHLNIFDKRDTLKDAYEEALDLVVYLKNEMNKREYMLTLEKTHFPLYTLTEPVKSPTDFLQVENMGLGND